MLFPHHKSIMRKLLIILLALCPMLTQAALRKHKKNTAATPQPEVLLTDTMDTDEPTSLDELDAKMDKADSSLVFLWKNDTLYVNCNIEDLPHRMTLVGLNGETMLKQLPLDTGAIEGFHPANDLYSDIWTNERVNPYKMPIDSLPDSLHINLAGACIPHAGYVTSKFGYRKSRFHYGTDLKVLVGDSIRASWDGQVRIVGWDPRGYGHYVVIRHDNGFETVYGHLSRPLFDENERIFAGEVLGLGGNTGRSTGSHLHYEIRYLGNAFNPEIIWDFENHTLQNGLGEEYLLSKSGTYGHNKVIKELKEAQYHKIRQGDTLSGIAKKYHTSVKALCRLNGIKESTILQLGKTLRVR